MPDDNPLADRGRSLEEDYFRKQDQELIERMRKAAAAVREREALEAKTGLHDPELLKDLQELGFTADTVSLLPLMPLLQVAWAEGGVSPQERRLIVDLARRRGITDGSPADAQLSEWLTRSPDTSVFRRAERLIAAVLAAITAEVASTATAAAAIFAWAGFVDLQHPASDFLAIELLNR